MRQIRKKRGFTIVELVIVIAVIAILAAVLIPTFSNLVKKSHVSVDRQLVYHINEAVAIHEAENGKPKTAYEALKATEELGFTINRLTPTTEGYDIVWDSVANRYALLNEKGEVVYEDENKPFTPGNTAWKICRQMPSQSEQTKENAFSVYLKGTELTGTIDAYVGVDVGENTGIQQINYINADAENNAVIRSNGGSLFVNAPHGAVDHYGSLASLDIKAVAPNSYHENGVVAVAKIQNGRIVLESTSELDAIHFVKTENGFNNIAIRIENQAKTPTFSRDAVTINADGTKVCVVETSQDKEAVWLYAEGIYEQVKVTPVAQDGTTATSVNKDTPTADSKSGTFAFVANEIANNYEARVEGTPVQLNENGHVADVSKVTEGGATSSSYFAGGCGSVEKPYLIATPAQFEKMGLADDEGNWTLQNYYYKLAADLEVIATGMRDDVNFVTKYFDCGTTFDGDGHTISLTGENCTVFNALENGVTVKNLNVVLNGKDLGLAEYGKDVTFENITVNGNVEFTKNNKAVFVDQFYDGDGSARYITFNNCVNNANVNAKGSAEMYNALFVGYAFPSANTSYKPRLNFNSCVNNGNVSGQMFSLFLCNPNVNKMQLSINIDRFENYGAVRVLNATENFNYYFATPTNIYNGYTINGVKYTSDKYADLPSPESDTNVLNCGLYVKSSADAKLAVTENPDKTFTVTAAKNSNVVRYGVYVRVNTTIYNADGTTNGSSTYVASEEMDAAGVTTIKNLAFVDKVWVNNNPSAEMGELSGNVVYVLNGNSYYLISDSYVPGTAGKGLGGEVRAAKGVSVVGYDADGNAVCSALLAK